MFYAHAYVKTSVEALQTSSSAIPEFALDTNGYKVILLEIEGDYLPSSSVISHLTYSNNTITSLVVNILKQKVLV